MQEDGACLFRSVGLTPFESVVDILAYHIYGDQEMHGQVRRLCMDYMVNIFFNLTNDHQVSNRDHFAEFITEDFDAYIARKRHEREHGNHVEIQAMSEMYSRCIEVYHYDLGKLMCQGSCFVVLLLWISHAHSSIHDAESYCDGLVLNC